MFTDRFTKVMMKYLLEKISMMLPMNSLTPESDWFLISPYSNMLESSIKVTRKKEMITNSRNSRFSNKFSLSIPQEM